MKYILCNPHRTTLGAAMLLLLGCTPTSSSDFAAGNLGGTGPARTTFQASLVEGFSQALRGVTPTIDPFTGKAREVWSGTKNGNWTNGTGVVVNSDVAPAGGGWHSLQVTRP
jgi:hypothetical protein